jgi:Phage derived protein Gp49-like (DUF891)
VPAVAEHGLVTRASIATENTPPVAWWSYRAFNVFHHARLSNLKELRPGSAGRSEIRILYIFDPKRNAVLLVAGDKAGNGRPATSKRSRWPSSFTRTT